MFDEKTPTLTEAQKKDFLKKFEDGLNEDRSKSALNSIDMSLSCFGGTSKVSLLDRAVSRYVFFKLFSDPKVGSFFKRASGDEYMTRQEFDAFEKHCQGITSRIARTALEVIFLESYKLPHTGVDLWVIESDWRDLTGRVQWTDDVEKEVDQQMSGIFNHFDRLAAISGREVNYCTIADVLTDDASVTAHEQEAFMEATISILREYISAKNKHQ